MRTTSSRALREPKCQRIYANEVMGSTGQLGVSLLVRQVPPTLASLNLFIGTGVIFRHHLNLDRWIHYPALKCGSRMETVCSTCYRESDSSGKRTINCIEGILGATNLAEFLLPDQRYQHQNSYPAYIKNYGHLAFDSIDINRAILIFLY